MLDKKTIETLMLLPELDMEKAIKFRKDAINKSQLMSNMIKIGNTVKILPNITKELKSLGFTNPKVFNSLIGSSQKVYSLWEDSGQVYATIDLCQEVPIQCLELINA
jgi:hypothetical protein